MADSPFEIVTTKKSGKVSSKKIIIGLVVIVFLALGVLTGVYLVRQQQDIREEASIACTERCPSTTDGYLYNCTPPEIDTGPQVSQCDSRFVGRIEPCGGRTFCCNGTTWSTNMTACAVLTPTPTPTKTPTPTPTSTPTQPSPTATAGATKTPTPTPTKTPTPTGTQSGTGGTTPTKTPTATPTKTPTPTPTKTPTPTGTQSGTGGTSSTKTPTATPTSAPTQVAQASKPPVPETGTGLPTIFAMALGVLVIIGSFVLAF